jgi:hypothetical protein
MQPLQIRRLTPDCAQWNAALEYAQSHLNTALLVAGDMMPPLRDLALHAAAFESDRLVGVAVQFDGFATSSLSVAAERSEVSDLLLRAFRPERGLSAVSIEQTLPEWCAGLTWSVDTWLRGPCIADLEAEGRCEAVVDAGELTNFYRSVHSPYWCPAMLESGRSRIIRDRDGVIVAACSVQFVLARQYAHMGALATAPGHGGHGFARTSCPRWCRR